MKYKILKPTEYFTHVEAYRPLIVSAMERLKDNIGINEAERRIDTGQAIVIEMRELDAIAGILVLEKQGRLLNIANIAGKFVKGYQLEVFEAIKAIAADNGCDKLTSHGRPGWNRLLKPLGFYLEGENLVCNLSEV